MRLCHCRSGTRRAFRQRPGTSASNGCFGNRPLSLVGRVASARSSNSSPESGQWKWASRKRPVGSAYSRPGADSRAVRTRRAAMEKLRSSNRAISKKELRQLTEHGRPLGRRCRCWLLVGCRTPDVRWSTAPASRALTLSPRTMTSEIRTQARPS